MGKYKANHSFKMALSGHNDVAVDPINLLTFWKCYARNFAECCWESKDEQVWNRMCLQ